MSQTNPLPIRIAQTLGLSTSLMLAGSTLTTSIYLVPRLLESPTPLMLRQWDGMFQQGKRTAPPIAVVAALSYFYLAYQEHKLGGFEGTGKLWRYVTAGLLSVGIVPYALIFLQSTNKKLFLKVEETRGFGVKDEVVEVGLGEETAHKLVDWWGVLNMGRGMLLALSGIVGAWTSLS